MGRGKAHGVALVVAALLPGSAIACGQILGVDDLRPVPADGGPEGRSDAVREATSEGSSLCSDDPASTVMCGSQCCNIGLGEACCISEAGALSCAKASDCAGANGTFARCDDPTDCPDAFPYCCVRSPSECSTAGCLTECHNGCGPYDTVCDPTAGDRDCPTGAGCCGPASTSLLPGLLGYSTCSPSNCE